MSHDAVTLDTENDYSALTIEQLSQVLPKHSRGSLKSEMVDTINNLAADDLFKEHYRDNILSYTSVMQDGKYKITSYLDAVRFVSHKLMDCTDLDAYIKTFPERYNRLLLKGTESKDIASYVSAYRKGSLVVKISEQSMIPTHILNADIYQKAINVQHNLMISANSEKVRTDAANSLLTHLKRPEVAKIELDIGIKENKSITELKATIAQLARAQVTSIEQGNTSVAEVAESPLLIENGEVIGDE